MQLTEFYINLFHVYVYLIISSDNIISIYLLDSNESIHNLNLVRKQIKELVEINILFKTQQNIFHINSKPLQSSTLR